MILRRIGKTAVIALAVLCLSGCWSRRELNELSIAVALGLDAAPNQKVLVSVQIVNPAEIGQKKAGPEGSPVYVFQSEASSVYEALREMTTVMNRKVYLSHLRLVVFGEELAKRGISDQVDFLSRYHELRTDFYLIVAKQARAQDVLSVLTPEESIPANELYSSLDVAEQNWAVTSKMTLDKLIDDLTTPGISPALTGLEIEGPVKAGAGLGNIRTTESPTLLNYDGIAVFRQDRLIGWLNTRESKGYHYISDKVNRTVIEDECPNGRFEVELMRSKTKLVGKVRNGNPEIGIQVHAEGNVADLSCHEKMMKPGTVHDIERLTEQNIKEKIKEAVNAAQRRYHADIFGFGEAIRRADPKRWHKLKAGWDARFSKIDVQINVAVKIRRIGTITDSIQSRIRK